MPGESAIWLVTARVALPANRKVTQPPDARKTKVAFLRQRERKESTTPKQISVPDFDHNVFIKIDHHGLSPHALNTRLLPPLCSQTNRPARLHRSQRRRETLRSDIRRRVIIFKLIYLQNSHIRNREWPPNAAGSSRCVRSLSYLRGA